MKKYFIPFPFLILIYFCKVLFADRYDEANKYYLDAYNLYRMGKMDQSLELLQKVVEIDPDHAEAHFGMGSIYFRQNMLDDAVREFSRVTRIKPEYAQAYERLWLAYKKLGMNDKAEEALQNYRKIILERTQSMAGEAPQIVKPVTPPSQESTRTAESQPSETRMETPQPAETRVSATNIPDTKVAESRPSEAETRAEKPLVVKPVNPQQEASKGRSVNAAESPPAKTGSIEKKSKEPARQPSVMKLAVKPGTESRPSDAKAVKKNTESRDLPKPLKKSGSVLFKNPFKGIIEKLEKIYIGKLLKGLVYYIVGVQVWLCIVASLFIYFHKTKSYSKN